MFSGDHQEALRLAAREVVHVAKTVFVPALNSEVYDPEDQQVDEDGEPDGEDADESAEGPGIRQQSMAEFLTRAEEHFDSSRDSISRTRRRDRSTMLVRRLAYGDAVCD